MLPIVKLQNATVTMHGSILTALVTGAAPEVWDTSIPRTKLHAVAHMETPNYVFVGQIESEHVDEVRLHAFTDTTVRSTAIALMQDAVLQTTRCRCEYSPARGGTNSVTMRRSNATSEDA